MNSEFTSGSFPLLRLTVRRLAMLVLSLMLFASTACAQGPDAAMSLSADVRTIMQPYLGKWRPTSYSEGLNVGSLTISEARLSLETGPSLTYRLEKRTTEAVILRVTDRMPANAFPGVDAIAFFIEIETATGPPPASLVKSRELLRICYLSGDIDPLDAGIKRKCGNIYTR